MESEDKNLFLRFSTFGLLFGLCFPLIGISFDLIYRDLSFTLADVIKLHRLNPIHFIIDSAPLILSFTAYGISRFVNKREEKGRKFLQKELLKNQQLARVTRCILEGKSHHCVENDQLDPGTLQSLKVIQERLSKQHEADFINQWTTEGQASVMDILKKMEGRWQGKILSLLCRLTESRMGVFWQLAEDGEAIEIQSCFALSEQLNREMRVERGQGLVGQVWQSAQTEHLETLPSHYLKIHSGLGEAEEFFLLIVPLCLEDQVYGILELASFTRIPEYRVRWLEEVGEQVALKIVTLRHESELTSLLQSTKARIDLLERENARLQQG